MFEDSYIDKEENSKLQEILFDWLMYSPKIKINPIDADDPEINDYNHVPDTPALAERVRPCIQVRPHCCSSFSSCAL